MPKLVLERYGIAINVPSRERANCYLSELLLAVAELHANLAKVKGLRIGPQLLQGLVEDLALNLDKKMIKLFDRDIKAYCATHKIRPLALTSKGALAAYKKYLTTGDLRKRLTAENPEVFASMALFCRQFVTNNGLALKRIQHDIRSIADGFLGSLGPDFVLAGIKSSGSDYHMQGKQVLILTFENTTGNAVKVIYKPTSIQADAMILGDHERLGRLDPAFRETHSMLECINVGLATRKEPLLAKYLIFPQEDSHDEAKDFDINRHYGYIEFLSHGPSESVDYDALLEEKLASEEPAMRDRSITNNPFNALTHKKAMEFIRSAAEAKSSDYITESKEDVARYSQQCGVLMALQLAAGVVDSHRGNLIMHQLNPYLIDVEASLTPRSFSIAGTSCFDRDDGSMSSASKSTEDNGVCLFDITGMHEEEVVHPDKNLLFFKEGEVLRACQPSEKEFLHGFSVGVDIVLNDPAVAAWYEQKAVIDMPVRFIAYQTSFFKGLLDVAHRPDASPKKLTETYAREYRRGFKEYEKEIKKFTPGVSDYPLPFSCVFAEGSHAALNEEFKLHSIPYYYARGVNLFDFRNQPVLLPPEFLVERAKLDGPVAESKEFFPMPLLEFTKRQIRALSPAKKVPAEASLPAAPPSVPAEMASLPETLRAMVLALNLDAPPASYMNFSMISLAPPSVDRTHKPPKPGDKCTIM